MSMKPWPNHEDFAYNVIGDMTYERARADAAIDRLRLAVEALNSIKDKERYDTDGIWHPMCGGTDMSEHAAEALEAIGEVP
jgi:hypothetical protein